MSEKEFLLDAFWIIAQIKPNGSYEEWREAQGKEIDKWLTYFHQTYFEVEFIKKEEGETLMGLPVVINDTLPDGTIQLRKDGKTLITLLDISDV